MAQARIVLRDTVLEQGEKLLLVTQLGSLTELIAVMFSRYSQHLEATWVVQPVSNTYAKAEPLPDVGYQPPTRTEPDFSFDEPLTGL